MEACMIAGKYAWARITTPPPPPSHFFVPSDLTVVLGLFNDDLASAYAQFKFEERGAKTFCAFHNVKTSLPRLLSNTLKVPFL
jgi:hypothetical protein